MGPTFFKCFLSLLFFAVVDSDAEMASGLGIALCGSSLRATSVLLSADVSEQADIKKRLQRLGAAGPPPPRGRSVALMFACNGRGRHFYGGAAGVESSVFRQLYPHVPLFGFFGNGEIGYDFPVEADHGDGVRSTDGRSPAGAGDAADCQTVLPQMYHSFTTVFVLLCFQS